jgi:uncharacterized protein YchJ
MTMEGETRQLPWEALQHTEGDIPWPALYEFAAAVVTDKSLTDGLVELYEQALQAGYDHEHYEDYYVPAIFALAAPQLSDQRRREIGVFLVEKLAEAGQEDSDISMEVLMAACGSLGPVVLPVVLETIAKEPDHEGAWFHLWGLTELAGQTEDAELRGRVIRACMELLQEADRGEIDPLDAIDAAWTLAILGHTDCKELLKRLRKKAAKSFCQGDYDDAVCLLEGRLDDPLPANLWEQPVKEWLEPRWRMARKWHEEHQGGNYEDDDFEAGSRRAALLAESFMESEEAKQLPGDLFEDAGFIVCQVLEYAWSYAGAAPEELDAVVLDQVLLEVFPRKMTADCALFEKVAPVTEALLKWMGSEGILADTTGLVETVHSWAEAIVVEGMNPQNWGMGKSLMMQATADGVDIANQEAVQRYIARYNQRLYQKDLPGFESNDFTPPIPIVEHAAKISRNAPCRCGSGKKYKKCCGGPKNASIHN